MTTEKLNELIRTISSACNDKNRRAVMEAVKELVKHGYTMGSKNQDAYWFIAEIEEAQNRPYTWEKQSS